MKISKKIINNKNKPYERKNTMDKPKDYTFEAPVEPELWEEPHFSTDHAYSIAFVGDPQYITCGDYFLGTKKNDQMFGYIADTAKERKLEHVIILGDMTDMGYHNDANMSYVGIKRQGYITEEWEISQKAIFKLGEAGIPYSVVRGNHDDYMIDDYFNVPEYTDQFKGCGGFFSDPDTRYPTCREPENPEGHIYWSAKTGVHTETISNSWRTAEIHGVKYLFVTVDYNPSKAVIEWVDEILGKYPDHRAIVSLHSYLTRRGTLVASEKGDTMFPLGYPATELWELALRKHANVVMVVSGHIGALAPIHSWNEGDNGNRVLQLLIDPQDYDTKEIMKDGEIVIEHGKQDTGLVCYFNFTEDGKTFTIDCYSTLLNKFLKYEENTFTLDV